MQDVNSKIEADNSKIPTATELSSVLSLRNTNVSSISSAVPYYASDKNY